MNQCTHTQVWKWMRWRWVAKSTSLTRVCGSWQRLVASKSAHKRYTHTHIHTHTHTHTPTHTLTHTHSHTVRVKGWSLPSPLITHTHTHTHTYAYTHARPHAHTHTYTHTYTHTHAHTKAHTCAHLQCACVQHLHSCIFIYICMYIYMYTYIYIHIYTYDTRVLRREICVYIYVYIYTYTDIYTRKYYTRVLGTRSFRDIETTFWTQPACFWAKETYILSKRDLKSKKPA